MYLQEIIISPDIFEKLSKEIKLDQASYLKNLDLKKIVWDKNNDGISILKDTIENIFLSCSFPFDKIIYEILDSFGNKGKHEFKTLKTTYDYCEDEIKNTLLNLSMLSESKIINSEDKSSLSLKDKHKELEELEILDLNDFNDPPSRSKQFCNNRKILIPAGQVFKFQNVLTSYFIDTKKIIVSDKYLRRKESFDNLVKMLRLCTELEELTIFTISRDNSSNDSFDLKFQIFKDRLMSEFNFLGDNLKVPPNYKVIHERILITDRFILEFGPGFNFVDDKFKARKDNIIIRIDKITDKEIETYSDILNWK